MSGGAWDYSCFRIKEIAAKVARSANQEQDAQISEFLKLFARLLNDVSFVAHELEWYLSADYGPECIHQLIEEVRLNDEIVAIPPTIRWVFTRPEREERNAEDRELLRAGLDEEQE